MKFLILISILLAGTITFADDSVYIKVGEANIKKSLIAVPPLVLLSSPSLAPNYKQVGTELYNTILNDLEVANLFTFIKQDAFLEDTSKVGLTPAPGNPRGFNFDAWSKIKADFLIRGGYSMSDTKNLELEIYVYYVPLAKLVLGKKYSAPSDETRTTAHTFANDLVKALTGKNGIFKTKFVVASDKGGKQFREIYVMDWDGRNEVKITNHRSVSLSPAWSPNGKTVSYTSFAYHPSKKGRNADLFTYDIYSGKRFLVSSYTGLNSGSTFSPNGQHIFLTLTKGQDPDIYRMTVDGEDLTRITNGPAGTLNVEPNISPDGKRIAFSSDRAGRPMIYIMDIDGKNIKRVTFAGYYNSSPSFSPDGKKLVFAGRDKGHFDIFIMDSDGSNMQRLTSAKHVSGRMADNEDPSFSPDSRHVVFTSNRSGKSQIYIIGIDGNSERRITVDSHNYYKARWSPYLN